MGLLRHAYATDPGRFMVALRGPERVIGFGIALQREHVWFLSQLYVLPAEQRRGIGHSLLRLVLPSADETPADASVPGVMATSTDSAQPASNALYARLGIVPRMPVFNLVGRPVKRAELRPLPADVKAEPFDKATDQARLGRAIDAIDAIDREVLGYAHPADHGYLRASGRTGFLYRTAAGDPIGYGYSSLVGRFGPVALLDETLTAPILAHLLTAIEPRGATSVWVPGANDRAMVALLRAGLKIEGFPAMLCWTRPFGAFERYLPAGLALL
jgi:hypothetical protein